MHDRLSAPSLLAAALLASSLGACGPSYPNCDEDGDCQEGEYCVDGLCQQCRSGADCAPGQECNNGRCDAIAGYCASDGDCPDGQECRDNRCAAIQSVDRDVPAPPPPPPAPCRLEPVYFAFDSDDLEGGTRDVISANARCMRERDVASVHITGYTDPRGTEEYNLALGDRRARSVMRYMTQLGVEQSRLSASSVGEEMSRGSDEGSWARDRKATFTER